MASFGGGIASSGGPCGAMTGGIALLGSWLGKEHPEEKDSIFMWKASSEFYKRFQSEVASRWESVNCSDITGVNWRDKEQAKAFYKGQGRMVCAENTGKAGRLLGEVIQKYLLKIQEEGSSS
jgi:C_GCAxxG_C_C family probable redox protein